MDNFPSSSGFEMQPEFKIKKYEYFDENIEEKIFDEVYSIYEKIFDPPHPKQKLIKRSQDKKEYLILMATVDEKPVGLKVGFPEDGYFHSWIGGVLSEFRQMGTRKL